MEQIIECADFSLGRQRLEAAGQSLERWYGRERKKLIERDLKLRLAAAKEDDSAKRAALREELRLSEDELRQLNEGMQRSSLRAALGRNREEAVVGRHEARLLLPSASATQRPPGRASDMAYADKGVTTKLNGLAAVYDSETNVGGYFMERIARGAFQKVLASSPDTRLLYNHAPDNILARTTSGTLRLSECRQGLIFWGDLLSDDPLSDALAARIQRRDISGCSFAFTVARDTWTLQPVDLDKREIIEISELYDCGPVTYPAYEKTTIAVVQVTEEGRSSDSAFDLDAYVAERDEEEWAEFDRTWDAKRKLADYDRGQRLRRLERRLRCAR